MVTKKNFENDFRKIEFKGSQWSYSKVNDLIHFSTLWRLSPRSFILNITQDSPNVSGYLVHCYIFHYKQKQSHHATQSDKTCMGVKYEKQKGKMPSRSQKYKKLNIGAHLPVAAAASAPSSFTSIKAFWITLLTDNGSSVVSIPLKLALVENISPRPSCKTYIDMLINYSFHLFGFTILSKYIKWCWICRLQVIYLRRVGKLSQPWLFSFCINISVK